MLVSQRRPVSRVLDDTYVLGPDIYGDGIFGYVWKAKDSSGTPVAIKQIEHSRLVDEKDTEHLVQEIKHQFCLRHDGLVKLLKVYQTDSSIFLVMEAVEGKTLKTIISNGPIPEEQALLYFRQLLDAVAYMHACGVAHRDLSDDNIIITGGKLKVCDFGVSVAFKNENDRGTKMQATICGSWHFMAPEVFSGKEYKANKADVWAMGVILYTMCAGSYPFNHKKRQMLMMKIANEEPAYPSHFSRNVTELIQALLKKDPKERPKMEDVAGYAWLGQYQWSWKQPYMVEWSNENLKRVGEPQHSTLAPLTVFGLIGVVYPLRLEHAVLDCCQNMRPLTFECDLSEQEARQAIRSWVEQQNTDESPLTYGIFEKRISMELTAQSETDDGECRSWVFTITVGGWTESQAIISIDLHQGDLDDVQVIKGLAEYLRQVASSYQSD